MIPDLNRIIEQVGKDKGIDKKILIDALEQALLAAARKKYGPKQEIESKYNEEAGEIELFQFKTVVEEVKNPQTEIGLEKARELDGGEIRGLRGDSRQRAYNHKNRAAYVEPGIFHEVLIEPLKVGFRFTGFLFNVLKPLGCFTGPGHAVLLLQMINSKK